MSSENKGLLPLADIHNISTAIQQAMNFESLRDSVGFICMWDEYRRSGDIVGEPCYGHCVAELLRVYGIDIDKIKKR